MQNNCLGALAGLQVIELAGIGPAPMCAMLLADLGASVLRIEREGGPDLAGEFPRRFNVNLRGRPSMTLDLKNAEARQWLLELVEKADVLIEGFRPGAAERLGLGPEACHARNSRLVYGRMTGWGQNGPLAQQAGHDINYLALTGALHAIGRRDQPPSVPLNLIGDFGGGALYLALGVLAALIERQRSGLGQVVDAAMVDGTASLMGSIFGLFGAGKWTDVRGSNLLDSGAYFYDVYQCSDGRWLAVGAIEKRFHDELLRLLEIEPCGNDPRLDRSVWPEMCSRLAEKFKTRTRDEWERVLTPVDVCVTPVLSMAEAPGHPHLRERGTFVDVAGVVQPAPAPRLSRTPAACPAPISSPGEGVEALLQAWGAAMPPIAETSQRREGP